MAIYKPKCTKLLLVIYYLNNITKKYEDNFILLYNLESISNYVNK